MECCSESTLESIGMVDRGGIQRGMARGRRGTQRGMATGRGRRGRQRGMATGRRGTQRGMATGRRGIVRASVLPIINLQPGRGGGSGVPGTSRELSAVDFVLIVSRLIIEDQCMYMFYILYIFINAK